jgi:MFS family permease
MRSERSGETRMPSPFARRPRAALGPYRRALGSADFRRLIAGYGISTLGNGAGSVAVAWLATELAPPGQRPYAVGFSLAAYLLPGALAGLFAGRWAHRLDPRLLIALDAGLRLAGLAAIAGLRVAGRLDLADYVSLLAVSSLLLTFGNGGIVALMGGHVDRDSQFAANSLVQALNQLSLTVIGPAVGGVLVGVLGAPVVLLVDAASFAVLLVSVAGMALPLKESSGPEPPNSGRLGLHGLIARPTIAWLLSLTVVFYGLYGPVETAFPILVQRDLRGGAALLGGIWAAFGIGALIGGLVAGSRTIRDLRRFAVAVVAGWGAALLLVAATDNLIVVLLGIALGGVIYAPYPAAATTLLQKELPGRELTSGAVIWSGVANGIVPVGMLIGGPLVGSLGPRGTMAASAAGTIGLALVVTAVAAGPPALRRRKTHTSGT